MASQTLETSNESFYRTWSHANVILVHLERGDVSEAEKSLATALGDQVDEDELLPFRALVAAHAGRTEEARMIIRENQREHWVNHNSFSAMAATGLLMDAA